LLLAQPVLSQQIRQLERTLGVTLFYRTSRRVRLTDAGETFLQHAERILWEVDRASDAMWDHDTGVSGRLRLGLLPCLGSCILPALLSGCRREASRIEVVVRDGYTSDLRTMVAVDRIEAAVISQAPVTRCIGKTCALRRSSCSSRVPSPGGW
jgi:DNA-binding transcriptional LysR family regulator